jgi:hypothetical protein
LSLPLKKLFISTYLSPFCMYEWRKNTFLSMAGRWARKCKKELRVKIIRLNIIFAPPATAHSLPQGENFQIVVLASPRNPGVEFVSYGFLPSLQTFMPIAKTTDHSHVPVACDAVIPGAGIIVSSYSPVLVLSLSEPAMVYALQVASCNMMGGKKPRLQKQSRLDKCFIVVRFCRH